MNAIPEFEMPANIRALPRDERGYPIPFFTALAYGKPDLRFADFRKVVICAQRRVCWVCSKPLRLGSMAFVSGPMGVANRYGSEGALHVECARFSLRFCPHLNNDKSQRREANTPADAFSPLGMCKEKPPVVGLVHTAAYTVERHANGLAFVPARILGVEWWANGRALGFRDGQLLAVEWLERRAMEIDPIERIDAINAWRGRIGCLQPFNSSVEV